MPKARFFVFATTVFAVAAAGYTWSSAAQPIFPDETAYVSQTYFWRLFLDRKRDDWAWVEYHAYDLPPLPKYLAGAALELAGSRLGNRAAAREWFRNTRANVMPVADVRRSRWPTALLGALGCVALFAIGTLAADERVGLVAAFLLGINPLYALHAQRAMSDVPAEAFTLCAEALGLWSWVLVLGKLRRGRAVLSASLLAGLSLGLAALSKLNGLVGALTLVGWTALGVFVSGPALSRRFQLVALTASIFGVALATFIALNPYATAHPLGVPPRDLIGAAPQDQTVWGRLRFMLDHRVTVSRKGQTDFPHNALVLLADKISAVAVQGFGRFGAFGPPHDSLLELPRFDRSRDWGAAVWLPCVLAGIVIVLSRGTAQARAGLPAIGWAIIAWWCVRLVTVTLFIPLAWDRYYLPIVAPSCLLGAIALVRCGDAAAAFLKPRATRA